MDFSICSALFLEKPSVYNKAIKFYATIEIATSCYLSENRCSSDTASKSSKNIIWSRETDESFDGFFWILMLFLVK